MKSSGKIIALVLLAFAVALVARHCWLSPEARVKRSVQQALDAVERQDVDAVMAFFHSEFADSLGLGAAPWRRLLDESWRRYRDVDVTLIQPTIEVDGDHARLKFHARVDATLAASMAGDGAPMRPTAYRQNVEITLKKDGATWKLLSLGDVTAAEWGIPVEKILE